MKRTIIAVGGGQIKDKTTLKIDEYMASLAKARAGENRANILFFGTASHDSMPYFNSFRKTYTSVFDIKAEVALIVYGEMDVEKIKAKIDKADGIYVGGGDTMFMLSKWKETGIDKMIISAYERGVPIIGLSAGAICWFEDVYTDSLILQGKSDEYQLYKGLGLIKGLVTPHYNERVKDFDKTFMESDKKSAVAIENDCAIVIENETIVRSISSGGKAYRLLKRDDGLIKEEL